MIRPIDMQQTLQALNDQAFRVNHDQAAVAYRQVQELGAARRENLQRAERPAETRARSEASFQTLHVFTEPAARQQEVREQARRRFEEQRAALRLYGPDEGRRRARGYTDEYAGLAFNLIA
jgi:hypothetical protein